MPDGPAGPARAMRPRELEDALNYHLYHPLAWRLALLLRRTRATPNMVSVAGAVLVASAGIAYTGLAWPASAALGMALHMAWHVVDGADGDLARLTGRAGPMGELVDGLCDYGGHIVLYLLLAAFLAGEVGMAAWPIAVFAALAHALQANHVEAQRRFYLHWIYGKPWLHNRRAAAGGTLARLTELYLAVATGVAPHALVVDRAVVAAAGDPARLERIRALVRGESGRLLRIEKLLGPNQRAIALGVAMLASGSPLAYFVYGGLWLSGVLAVSVIAHERAYRRIASLLG